MSRFQKFPSGATRQLTADDLDAAFDGVDVVKGVESGIFGDGSWMDAHPGLVGVPAQARVFSGSQDGRYGLMGAARSKNGGAAFGVGAFGINDRTDVIVPTWAAYIEARRMAGAGTTWNVESNVLNLGTVLQPRPDATPDGSTINMMLSVGREDVPGSADCTTGLMFIPNGNKYCCGIMFNDAVRDHVLDAGETFARPIAMDMPGRYGISWRNRINGNISAGIFSDVINQSGGGYIGFVDTGVSMRDAGNNEIARFGILGAAFYGTAVFNGSVGIQGNLQFTGLLTCPSDAAAKTAGVQTGFSYINSATGAVTVRQV